MSDVADMLGLSAKSSSGNLALEEAQKIMGEKAKVKGARKPKGMSREVYDLLGKDGLTPSVQGNVIAPNFKNKRANALKGKWIWTSITSSARSNNQPVFFHWIKAEQSYVDYPYASFNVKFDSFNYTDEEYDKYLSEDISWSKADTDELVKVCHQYDMRWPVVSDRVELTTARAVEDMQDRYYFVRAVISAKRAEQSSTVSSSVPATAIAPAVAPASGFNLQQEKKRRRAQDMLFKKTKEEEAEEAQLREELKAVDAALKKNKKAKSGPEPAAATAATASAAAAVASGPAPSTLGPGLVPRTILAAPGAGGVAADVAAAVAAAAASAGAGAAVPPAAPVATGPAPGRPCLQSSRLYSGTVPPLNLTGSLTEFGVTKQDTGLTGGALSKKMLNKMALYLRELEIPENPLPTKAVCDAVEQVKLSTVTLLSLHNLIARKEKEIAQLLLQAQAGGAGPEGATADGPAGASKSKSSRSVKKEPATGGSNANASTSKSLRWFPEDAAGGASSAVGAASAGSGGMDTADSAMDGVWVKGEPEVGGGGGDDHSSSSSSALYFSEAMDVVPEQEG